MNYKQEYIKGLISYLLEKYIIFDYKKIFLVFKFNIVSNCDRSNYIDLGIIFL